MLSKKMLQQILPIMYLCWLYLTFFYIWNVKRKYIIVTKSLICFGSPLCSLFLKIEAGSNFETLPFLSLVRDNGQCPTSQAWLWPHTDAWRLLNLILIVSHCHEIKCIFWNHKVYRRFNKSQWSLTIHLFIYCLFNDAISSWGKTASYGQTVYEQWIRNSLKLGGRG